MSNFIYGRVLIKDLHECIKAKIDYSLVEYCLQNNFAIQFIDIKSKGHSKGEIYFRISDNFIVEHCEYFMEPIIYTTDGIPKTENLCKDVEKLKGLVSKIFKIENAESVELNFFYGEFDEGECEICKTSIEQMSDLILQKYLSDTGFPIMDIVISKH